MGDLILVNDGHLLLEIRKKIDCFTKRKHPAYVHLKIGDFLDPAWDLKGEKSDLDQRHVSVTNFERVSHITIVRTFYECCTDVRSVVVKIMHEYYPVPFRDKKESYYNKPRTIQ